MISVSPQSKKFKMTDTRNHNTALSHDASLDNSKLDAKSLNRYSRQNAALGAETTAKLTKMKVLIYGVKGVGIETAKNLTLQGAGAITVKSLLDSFVFNYTFHFSSFIQKVFL